MLITQGEIDVNGVSKRESIGQGETALHLAVRHNHINCVKLLLDNKANVNATDNFGFRPIHDAAQNGFTECLKELLAKNASVVGAERPGFEHVTPLYYAIRYNHAECVQVLQGKCESNAEMDRLIWQFSSSNPESELDSITIKKDFSDAEIKEWLKNSALVGNTKFLQKMIDVLKDQNKADDFNKKYGCLVILATTHGHQEYLENLFKLKCDSNESSKNNSTALHYAARYGQTHLIDLLLKEGAGLENKNADRWTPLHIAIRLLNVETIEKLIQCGCDVNMIGGEEDDTPLHLALKLPVDTETLKALLRGKPSAAVTDKKGELPTQVIDPEDVLYEIIMEYVRN